MNFPHRPEDQVLPVGCPVEVGVGSENGPRFLLVVTEVLVNRGFNTCLQISDKKYRVGPYPLYKCKLPAIGRDRRGHRTTRPAGNPVRLPGLAVVAVDHIYLATGVFRSEERRGA